MARLLDRSTFVTLTGNSAYADTTQYSDARLAAIFGAVDAMVSRYLHYTPWLQLTSGEEGMAAYLGSGDYAGRYLCALQNRPLVPGTPTQIFTDLRLLYAPTSVPATSVDLTYTQVSHSTALVYVLAAGMIDALTGLGFQQAPMRGLRAVSFVASYWSGWATGISTDPTPPTGVTPDPIPGDVKLASAMLAQEILGYQAAQTAQSASSSVPASGYVVERRVGERSETYMSIPARTSGQATLGYGTPLSVNAQAILDQYKKRPAPVLAG